MLDLLLQALCYGNCSLGSDHTKVPHAATALLTALAVPAALTMSSLYRVSSGDKDVYDLMQKVCWEGKRPELPDLPKVACRVAETVLVDLWVCGRGLDR